MTVNRHDPAVRGGAREVPGFRVEEKKVAR